MNEFAATAANCTIKSRIYVRQFERFEIYLAIITITRLARLVLRVANPAAARTHNIQKRILLAIHVCFEQVKRFAACLTLEP